MENAQLEKLIKTLLARSGSEVNVQLESYFPGGRLVGGKYSIHTHTITLYIEAIKEQCLQIFSTLDYFNEYIAVVFAHELGHAEDKELPSLVEQLETSSSELEQKRAALQIEENAWRFAEQLVPEVEPGFMKKIIFHSLQSYREEIQKVGA